MSTTFVRPDPPVAVSSAGDVQQTAERDNADPGWLTTTAWPEQPTLGRAGVHVGRLGLGLRGIGSDPLQARRLIERATEVGIRYFDVAPSYGRGTVEERLGGALELVGRDRLVLSTKAGQLIRHRTDGQRALHAVYETVTGGQAGLRLAADRARRAIEAGVRVVAGSERSSPPVRPAQPETVESGPPPSMIPVCDYSYEGAMRSVEESLMRLGTDRVDIVYLHDPDVHHRQAMRGAYRALDGLRRAGAIGAVGASMNDGKALASFADEGDFDVFLLAGRYTLLDQTGATTLFPITASRRIGLVVAGVFNGGLLADPAAADGYNWGPISTETRRRAVRLAEICRSHEVNLKAAALQFTFANPALSTLLLGATSAEELDEILELLVEPLPTELWTDLRERGIIAPELPVPSGTADVLTRTPSQDA